MADPVRNPHDHQRQVRVACASHGLSVVELSRRLSGHPCEYVRDGERNRRVTATTPIALHGPAAGCELLRTADDPEGRTSSAR